MNKNTEDLMQNSLIHSPSDTDILNSPKMHQESIQKKLQNDKHALKEKKIQDYIQNQTQTTSKKKNKCSHPECSKKLGLIPFTCQCGIDFCAKHHNRHSHSCTYDHSSDSRKDISKNNPKIGDKFTKI